MPPVHLLPGSPRNIWAWQTAHLEWISLNAPTGTREQEVEAPGLRRPPRSRAHVTLVSRLRRGVRVRQEVLLRNDILLGVGRQANLLGTVHEPDACEIVVTGSR
jgi:hypothetical protein